MALTREDLQAIGELIDQKLDNKLTPMQADIQGLKVDMQGLKTDMSEVKERVASIEVTQEEVKQRVTKIEVTQENVVLPRIQLLAEGHSGLADRLDRLEELPEQIEDIQTTVSVLNHVFKGHTHG